MLTPRLSPLLSSIPGLSHGFFTRQGGVSQKPFSSLNGTTKYGDSLENVSENQRRIENYLGGNLVTVQQVHGNKIATFQDKTRTPFPADALTTQQTGLMLGVMTADCVPILWVDPCSKRIAATHAGWRGTLNGVVEATHALFETPPWVALGPSLQQESFEVGDDVLQKFCEKTLYAKDFFKPHNQRHLFDLPGYICQILQRLGVTEIDRIQENTYTLENIYFSYRRSTHQQNKAFGVMISAIGWKTI